MKRSTQILFVLVFLLIIAIVPIVQTTHEYRANTGHRIQMLDLVEDIFITPLQKAEKDAILIDSIRIAIANLDRAITAGVDTNVSNLQNAIGYCDESIIRVNMLKQSVVDYNRHIGGAKNRFLAADTMQPYYRSLARLGADLDMLLKRVQYGTDLATAAVAAGFCKSDVDSVKTFAVSAKGVGSYIRLTLHALSRVLVGADYLRPYEKEMEKSSVFAQTIRPWLLLGYYRAFTDLGSKGIMGLHHWFFYRSDVDYLVKPYVTDVRSKVVDPTDVAISDSIVRAIVTFKNQLAEKGIDLLFVIMPTKPSIYPDMLSGRMKSESAGKISHSLRMMEELNKAGVETIDLFSALAEERKKDSGSGDSLFLRTDTHFKARGVLATARTIAGRVKQYPWYVAGSTDYAIDSVIVDRIGDVGEMVDFPRSIMSQHLPPFQAKPTKCYQVWKIDRDDQGAVTDKTMYKDDFKNSQILILGDSFSRIYQTDQPKSAGWIAHLAKELAQPVASIVNDGGASTLVRESLARKPQVLKGKKLVIWEVVERDFRYGEEGWKDIVIGKK